MQFFLKIILYLNLIFLISCSASYEKLSNNVLTPPNEFSKYLTEAYKSKADFEAKEMHDWNSAKLYSEKALKASIGEKILPQKISYWKINAYKRFDLIKAYNNLMIIYNEALILDPFNLAKAVSSLDCWSEQQEENWQTWDINKCRDDFLNAMHTIYNSLNKNIQDSKKLKNLNNSVNVENSNNITIVTQNEQENILQTIYFDFDKYDLTKVNLNKIKNFINTNKKIIKKYIIIGHTDTKGSKNYNMTLSKKRAEVIEEVLLRLGIQKENIKIFGKGESDLSVMTGDEIAHPTNRRAEISPLN